MQKDASKLNLMKKEFIVFLGVALIGYIAFYGYQSRFIPCTISQKYFTDLNIADIKISFETDSPVDSFAFGDLSLKSYCTAGTTEENASWVAPIKGYRCKVISTDYGLDKGTKISATLEGEFLRFNDCESPNYLYVPVTLYRKGQKAQYTLRVCTNKLKTEYM